VAFLLSLVVGGVCYLIAGNSLDLFIGGVFFAALLAPPLSAIAGRSLGGILAITLGIGGSWFMPVHAEMVTVWQWAICVTVLLSFAALLMAGVQLLMRFGLSAVTASAVTTIGALCWLSWPVWLSASLVGSRLHWSVVFHPLFAINHVVAGLGIWTRTASGLRPDQPGSGCAVSTALLGLAGDWIPKRAGGNSVFAFCLRLRILLAQRRGGAEEEQRMIPISAAQRLCASKILIWKLRG